MNKYFKEMMNLFGSSMNPNENEPDFKNILKFSLVIFIGFVLIFSFWGIFANLDSAALAQGKIISSTRKKTIQHKEGGIIKQILVKEGSRVEKGDPLIILEDTDQRSKYNLLKSRLNDLIAKEARLIAERDNLSSIPFPKELTDHENDPDVKESMESEKKTFHANKDYYNNRVEIINSRIKQLNDEIWGLNAQQSAAKSQLELSKQEEAAVAELEKRKVVNRPRLLGLRREIARINGEIGKFGADISGAIQKIEESKEQLTLLENEQRKTTLDDLYKIQADLGDNRERFTVAFDELGRTVIRSPENGIVLSPKFTTPGGVLSPGEALMQIVPLDDKLIIEAMVNPLDIDAVKPGLEAIVQITPLKQRGLVQILGKVVVVSADLVPSSERVPEHYLVEVEIPKSELKQLKGMELYPGMPVQVMIVTAKRSPFNYFFSPVWTSFDKAFRED